MASSSWHQSEATELAEAQIGSVGGGGLKVQGWSVIGRAGPGIRSVEIEPAGVPPILATLENGWFAGLVALEQAARR